MFANNSNVRNIYLDFGSEHATMVNSMIAPAICDKTKTIFEAVWDVIPNTERSVREASILFCCV
jgi:hypothetical protein